MMAMGHGPWHSTDVLLSMVVGNNGHKKTILGVTHETYFNEINCICSDELEL